MVAEAAPLRYFVRSHGIGKFIATFCIARCCIYWHNCWSSQKRCFVKTIWRNGRKKDAKDDFATQQRLMATVGDDGAGPECATGEPFKRTQGTEAAP
jgi:hypothetical protein